MQANDIYEVLQTMALEYNLDVNSFVTQCKISVWLEHFRDIPKDKVVRAYRHYFDEGHEFPPKLPTLLKIIRDQRNKVTYANETPNPPLHLNKWGEWEDDEGRIYAYPNEDVQAAKQELFKQHRFERDLDQFKSNLMNKLATMPRNTYTRQFNYRNHIMYCALSSEVKTGIIELVEKHNLTDNQQLIDNMLLLAEYRKRNTAEEVLAEIERTYCENS